MESNFALDLKQNSRNNYTHLPCPRRVKRKVRYETELITSNPLSILTTLTKRTKLSLFQSTEVESIFRDIVVKIEVDML